MIVCFIETMTLKIQTFYGGGCDTPNGITIKALEVWKRNNFL